MLQPIYIATTQACEVTPLTCTLHEIKIYIELYPYWPRNNDVRIWSSLLHVMLAAFVR